MEHPLVLRLKGSGLKDVLQQWLCYLSGTQPVGCVNITRYSTVLAKKIYTPKSVWLKHLTYSMLIS